MRVVSLNIDSHLPFIEERLATFSEIIKHPLPRLIFIQDASGVCVERLSTSLKKLGYGRLFSEENLTQKGRVCIIFYLSDSVTLKSSDIIHKKYGTLIRLNDLWLWNVSLLLDSSVAKKEILDLSSTTRQIQQPKTIVAIGDFGFRTHSRGLETYINQQGWTDLWVDSGLKNMEYTINYKKNKYVQGTRQDRPDRVFLYDITGCGKAELVRYELLGNEDPVSSHYALDVELGF